MHITHEITLPETELGLRGSLPSRQPHYVALSLGTLGREEEAIPAWNLLSGASLLPF